MSHLKLNYSLLRSPFFFPPSYRCVCVGCCVVSWLSLLPFGLFQQFYLNLSADGRSFFFLPLSISYSLVRLSGFLPFWVHVVLKKAIFPIVINRKLAFRLNADAHMCDLALHLGRSHFNSETSPIILPTTNRKRFHWIL